MITITKDKAIELLKQAVEEKGRDHTVIYCAYQIEGEPSCIVGNALARVMPTESFLAAFADEAEFATAAAIYPENVNTSVIRSLGAYLSDFGVLIEPEAIEVFNDAQIVQDSRAYDSPTDSSWGAALDSVCQSV